MTTLARMTALAMALMATASAAQDFLSEAEIREQIIDGRITGLTQDGAVWTESYLAEGIYVFSVEGQEPLVGAWEADGEFLCTVFDEIPELNSCWAVILEGDTVTYISEHGENAGGGTLTRF